MRERGEEKERRRILFNAIALYKKKIYNYKYTRTRKIATFEMDGMVKGRAFEGHCTPHCVTFELIIMPWFSPSHFLCFFPHLFCFVCLVCLPVSLTLPPSLSLSLSCGYLSSSSLFPPRHRHTRVCPLNIWPHHGRLRALCSPMPAQVGEGTKAETLECEGKVRQSRTRN